MPLGEVRLCTHLEGACVGCATRAHDGSHEDWGNFNERDRGESEWSWTCMLGVDFEVLKGGEDVASSSSLSQAHRSPHEWWRPQLTTDFRLFVIPPHNR